MTVAGIVHIDLRKWPDNEHYQCDTRYLGRDQYGYWICAPAGTPVRRGPEEPPPLRAGFIALIPEDEWWVAEFYTDHPEIAVYVNIGTPPQWHDHRVTQVDLDLDVVRRLDGTVEIIDQDEFEDNRAAMGYPGELVTGAREAAERAAGMLRESVEPFGVVAAAWLAQVDPDDLRLLPGDA